MRRIPKATLTIGYSRHMFDRAYVGSIIGREPTNVEIVAFCISLEHAKSLKRFNNFRTTVFTMRSSVNELNSHIRASMETDGTAYPRLIRRAKQEGTRLVNEIGKDNVRLMLDISLMCDMRIDEGVVIDHLLETYDSMQFSSLCESGWCNGLNQWSYDRKVNPLTGYGDGLIYTLHLLGHRLLTRP